MPEKLGVILEVGSRYINGSSKRTFVHTEYDQYIGIDIQPGRHVDIVMNGHDLAEVWKVPTFDVVICMNTLEHDNKFWLTIEAINKVIKKGGYLFLSVPGFNVRPHDYPSDYWRMNEKAVREVLMEGYEVLNLEKHNTWAICAVGRKL